MADKPEFPLLDSETEMILAQTPEERMAFLVEEFGSEEEVQRVLARLDSTIFDIGYGAPQGNA